METLVHSSQCHYWQKLARIEAAGGVAHERAVLFATVRPCGECAACCADEEAHVAEQAIAKLRAHLVARAHADEPTGNSHADHALRALKAALNGSTGSARQRQRSIDRAFAKWRGEWGF